MVVDTKMLRETITLSTKNLKKTIKVCIKNGDRILEDAKCLLDSESYASAYFFAKLAQEEFAKSFILKLIESGSLKWTKEVRRSLNHHISKQLMGIILEYLNPSIDEFLEMAKNESLLKIPSKVADAMNIYIHEVLGKWESQNWVWAEDPNYDQEAKSIYEGREDELKQDAMYIRISRNGEAASSPKRFKSESAKKEVEKAERYGRLVNEKDQDLRYKEIARILKALRR